MASTIPWPSIWVLCHALVIMALISMVALARGSSATSADQSVVFSDSAMIWFLVVFTCRYARLFLSIYSFYRYKLATPVASPSVTNEDVTIIIPTVSCSEVDNPDFEECITTCLINKPAELLVVTDNAERAVEAEAVIQGIRKKLQTDMSILKHLGPKDVSAVEIKVLSSGIASKRRQVAFAVPYVTTSLILFVDDHVFLPPKFIPSVIPAFEDGRVGLCGTNKEVRRQTPKARTLTGRYFEAFWNVMGAVYLARHNFEIRATNALDGGVFVVSGRAQVIRTQIVQDPEFLKGFLNERFLFGTLPPNSNTPLARHVARYVFGVEPTESENARGLDPDDDNFVTRWVVRTGWGVKIQYSEDTKIETTLGVYPKFIQQCLRWSRTTIRSNPCSLLTDRVIWRRWPVTVWTTYIACLFNFALIWDPVMMHALTRTQLYMNSENKAWIACVFVGWIWATKLVKPLNYFISHPMDLLLFFFPLPAGPLFSYFHSFLKAWSVLTFWDGTWSGRPNLQKDKERKD